MTIASAKMSWNQLPQAMPPSRPKPLILVMIVITRLVIVAQSMKIIGKMNILLFLPTLPSHAATAMRARPARSWLAAPNRPQIWLRDRPPRTQPTTTMNSVPVSG